MPHQSGVEETFHQFSNTASETDGTVALSLGFVLSFLVDWNHDGLSSHLWYYSCSPAFVEGLY